MLKAAFSKFIYIQHKYKLKLCHGFVSLKTLRKNMETGLLSGLLKGKKASSYLAGQL